MKLIVPLLKKWAETSRLRDSRKLFATVLAIALVLPLGCGTATQPKWSPSAGKDAKLHMDSPGAVPVAPSMEAHERWIKLAVANDTLGLDQMIQSGEILGIEEGTHCRIIDLGVFGPSEVRIAEGPHKGSAVFVNSEWLREPLNSSRKLDERDAREARKQLQEPVTVPPGRQVIGMWLDDRPVVRNRITIFRENGKLFMERAYPDGSAQANEIVASKSNKGQRFQQRDENDHGDHYIVTLSGDLELRDDEGLISTAPKLKQNGAK